MGELAAECPVCEGKSTLKSGHSAQLVSGLFAELAGRLGVG